MVIVQHHTCTTYQVPGTASVGTSTVVYFSVLRVPHTIVNCTSQKCPGIFGLSRTIVSIFKSLLTMWRITARS